MMNSTSHRVDSKTIEVLFLVETTIWILSLMTNLLTNSAVITAISRYPWLRKPLFITLQMLAVADVLASVHLIGQLLKRFQSMDFVYIIRSITSIAYLSSVLHVIYVAMERCFAVNFPLTHRVKLTCRRIRIGSAITWSVAFIIGVCALIVMINLLKRVSVKDSEYGILATQTYFTLTLILLLIAILVYLQFRIHAVIDRRRRLSNPTVENAMETNNLFKLQRSTKLLLAVILGFVGLRIPLLVLLLYAAITGNFDGYYKALLDLFCAIGSLSSSLNFFIYSLLNRKLMVAFKLMLGLTKNDDVINGEHRSRSRLSSMAPAAPERRPTIDLTTYTTEGDVNLSQI